MARSGALASAGVVVAAVLGGCAWIVDFEQPGLLPGCDVVIADLPDQAALPEGGDVLPPGATIIVAASDFDRRAASRGTDENGFPTVTLRLLPGHTERLADFTRSHVGKEMAVVLGDRVVAVPVIRSPIEDGVIVISGTDVLGACVGG